MENKYYEEIIEDIFQNHKLKRAKTNIFNRIEELTKIRPSRIFGRGNSLNNVLADFYEKLCQNNTFDFDKADEIVSISVLSSIINMRYQPNYSKSKNKRKIFQESLKILESTKDYLPSVTEDVLIFYYENYISLKFFNGENDVNWEELPEVVKNNDRCKFNYFRLLEEEYMISKEEVLTYINEFINADDFYIKSLSYCMMAYIKGYSNKENDFALDSESKKYAKKAKSIADTSNDKTFKSIIKVLSTVIVNQNRVHRISSKDKYVRVKKKVLDLIEDLKKENDVISIIRITHYFILLAMNMTDIVFALDLIEKVLYSYNKYELNFIQNKKEIYTALIDILTNVVSGRCPNEIDIKYFNIVSDSYYEYIDAFPTKTKIKANSQSFLIMGNVYEYMSIRPNDRDLIFLTIRNFIKKILKETKNIELVKKHSLIKKCMKSL